MSRDEEHRLAQRVEGGDREALHRLVLSHGSLVSAMARTYARLGVSKDDLESEGWVGLLDAARRFDPDRGTRFTTYARWWVRAYMLAFASGNRRMVAAPGTRTMRRLRTQLRKTERQLEQVFGRTVTREELAEVLGVAPSDIADAQGMLARLDVPVGADDSEQPQYEPIAGDPSPEEEAMHNRELDDAMELTDRALHVLDDRERHVVEDRLLSDEPRTLRELGRDLGVSRERVRQLKVRAMKKMRRAVGRTAALSGAGGQSPSSRTWRTMTPPAPTT